MKQYQMDPSLSVIFVMFVSCSYWLFKIFICQLKIRSYKYITSKSVLVCLKEINIHISGKHSIFNENFLAEQFNMLPNWLIWYLPTVCRRIYYTNKRIKIAREGMPTLDNLLVCLCYEDIYTVQHLFAITWTRCLYFNTCLLSLTKKNCSKL